MKRDLIGRTVVWLYPRAIRISRGEEMLGQELLGQVRAREDGGAWTDLRYAAWAGR